MELRTEATRLAERAARWLLRQPELAGRAGAVDRRRCVTGSPRRSPRCGPGCRGWLLGARGRGLRRAGRAAAGGRACPPELAAEVAAAPLLPAALDLAVVAERTGAPIALAGQVMQCLAERLGLVPLRELVIALPRDRRWPSMARATLRDDLATEQASLTADVLGLRDAPTRDPPDELVARWADGLGHHPAAGGRAAGRHHRRATGRSSPSCWSPSARCAACAGAARPAAFRRPRAVELALSSVRVATGLVAISRLTAPTVAGLDRS